MPASKVQKLLHAAKDANLVVILTHDSPDPDALAAGWAIGYLLETVLHRPYQFIIGGHIARAENRAFLDLLDPPVIRAENWQPPTDAGVIIVDVPYLPRYHDYIARNRFVAVIDHHESFGNNDAQIAPFFKDVRPNTISTSSIISCYMNALDVEPPRRLATALTYGIYSDAKGVQTKFVSTDKHAVTWLAKYSDPALLVKIENAPLPRSYYKDLTAAIESCTIHQKIGYCFLPQAGCMEMVGEIADLLIRCDQINALLCVANHGERLYYSARTKAGKGSAAELLDRTLFSLPHASRGGHERRAGGSMQLKDLGKAQYHFEQILRQLWLEANHITSTDDEKLISEIPVPFADSPARDKI